VFENELAALGDPPLLLALVLVIAFAGLVHGTLGLGFPVVSTPILAVMFDVRTAILLTLLPTVAVNIASILGARTGYGESLLRFWPLLGWALLGGLGGTWLLSQTDPAPFKLLLAALIVLFLWSSHANRIPRAWLEAHPAAAMMMFGIAAGFSAGTTNVMVAVLIIYFLAIELPRATMVPIMNTGFAVGKVSQLIVLTLAGMVTLPLIAVTAPLALIAVGALSIGQRLRDRVPVETYRQWLRWLLMLMAALLVGQYGYELIR
jgi:uncharacterized membrane protein YfcA